MENRKQYDYLIVGAGLFGSVFAYEASQAGKHCLVIDKRQNAGGNIFCENVDGIHVHKYGAHIFHTDKKEIWQYVNRLIEFNRYTNSPLAYFEGKLYNLPFNMNTFYQLWGVCNPEEAKAKIEEQRSEYAYIENPCNLKNNGEDRQQNFRLSLLNVFHFVLHLIIIILMILIKGFLLADIIN